MGPIRHPETLVRDYHSTLCNTPEEGRSLHENVLVGFQVDSYRCTDIMKLMHAFFSPYFSACIDFFNLKYYTIMVYT
jgi:hypothetical protein